VRDTAPQDNTKQ